MRIRVLAFVLFTLASAAALAQDLPKTSPASSGIPADAPFLLPDEPGAVAPVWLTLNCSQFDHGSCHYVPDPAFPDECCITVPHRFGCLNYCVAPPIE